MRLRRCCRPFPHLPLRTRYSRSAPKDIAARSNPAIPGFGRSATIRCADSHPCCMVLQRGPHSAAVPQPRIRRSHEEGVRWVKTHVRGWTTATARCSWREGKRDRPDQGGPRGYLNRGYTCFKGGCRRTASRTRSSPSSTERIGSGVKEMAGISWDQALRDGGESSQDQGKTRRPGVGFGVGSPRDWSTLF